jgi:predicted extracellular nuclease
MKISFLIFSSIQLLSYFSINGQDFTSYALKDRYFRLMFYNVENLFDTENDSLTNDEEFLPDGERHWTPNRYWEKLQHISSVIVALGGWQPPEIIGLAEIENRKVLEDLCFKSSLSNLKYKIIHKESPDLRGIDVALLYQANSFKPLGYKTLKVTFPNNPGSTTRDILYVNGLTKNKDTLHIFINHWPSRTGGQLESEPNRMQAAKILRLEIDSIFSKNPNAKIVIMGDLNDYPDNVSLTDVLRANRNFDKIIQDSLYNLSSFLEQSKKIGSHKFDGEWGILDQIIVSGALLNKKDKLFTKKENASIFNADFLLEDDENYSGKTNFRTYIGFKYHGGYSDHLPVFLDLENITNNDNEKN